MPPGQDVGLPHHSSVHHLRHLVCRPEHLLVRHIPALVVVTEHLVPGTALLQTGWVSASRWGEASPGHHGQAPILVTGQVDTVVVSNIQILLAGGQRCATLNRKRLGISLVTQ